MSKVVILGLGKTGLSCVHYFLRQGITPMVLDTRANPPGRQEFLLVIMGGVFVMETMSVILQVGSYKLRGQRIFRMAPIHHHYELKGWPEPRVIVRFWIITLVLVLLGLVTLKLR